MVNLNPPTKTVEGLGEYHRCLKCNIYLSNHTNANYALVVLIMYD